jgi:isoamylase
MAAGRVTSGSPEPLGVTLTKGGVNVAVWSAAAEAIDVCLFDEAGHEERIRLPERTGEVFHGHVEGIGAGARYGLRAHGAYAPERGLRFDPTKLLVDPYAVALDGPFRLDPVLFAKPEAGLDSAGVMPKCVVTGPAPAGPPPLLLPWDRTIIYEAHVRGLTRLHPDVPEQLRGTFAALACPPVIAHLQGLGITTLELLPSAAWIDERHLPPLGLTNYWGYNPVAFCAPDPRLAPGGWAEVRSAVRALAEAGIEVVLDVVLNHTGEGDALGPTLSLRGFDNAGYYRLDPEDPARYVDDAGTGNTLALDRPQGVRLAMEALRTWARRGGVSGFRFDLATVLGRRANGFDPAAPLLTAIGQDPELRGLKLIAEPWDCGPGGHQLGRFPAAFGEWNDRFRDGVRRFWGGFGATRGELAARLAGSQDVFAERGRPSRSVNFITAHDGFTLADLVSYAAKHNEANGEQGRDGTDGNWSWNGGVEGPTDDPEIRARRLADQRALLATLVLARGTPMLSMGAELGQSQGGNNNAYAQDNATSWIDWAAADPDLAKFVGGLTAARAEHLALRQDRFLTGEAQESPFPDVAWFDADGEPLPAAAQSIQLVALSCA